MAYVTPKTNWAVTLVNGVYTGDFLNATDYNRIANNIVYIAAIAESLYSIVIDLGPMPEMTTASIPLAGDFNVIEDNIQTLCNAIYLPASWTGKKTYYANGTVPGVADWNRWEQTIRDLKERIDYDARWIGFKTLDGEAFITADGKTFMVLEG